MNLSILNCVKFFNYLHFKFILYQCSILQLPVHHQQMDQIKLASVLAVVKREASSIPRNSVVSLKKL